VTTPATAFGTDRFLRLLREELALDVGEADLHVPFDALEGWDSVMLLKLLGAAEALTGRPAPMIAVLEAGDLRAVHAALAGEGRG
jgi:hypothetical protein